MDACNFQAPHIHFEIGPVESDIGKLRSNLLAEPSVPLVVPEDDMDRSGEAVGQICDDKRSIEIACMHKMCAIGRTNLFQSSLEMVEAIVRIGHQGQAG